MILLHQTLNYYRQKKTAYIAHIITQVRGFPELADIIRYYKEMFYSLYATVRPVQI